MKEKDRSMAYNGNKRGGNSKQNIDYCDDYDDKIDDDDCNDDDIDKSIDDDDDNSDDDDESIDDHDDVSTLVTMVMTITLTEFFR